MYESNTLKQMAFVGCGAVLWTIFSSGTLGAQSLPVGNTTTGTTNSEAVAAFEFQAGSAGVLTVVIRAAGQTDLVLMVTDRDGQVLPDGESDQDLGGNSGAEQVAVTIPRRGTYFVRVRPFSMGQAKFSIGASWLEFPELEQPPDPDGAPSSASRMTVGEPIDDSIDGSVADHWDWFSITIKQAGLLTVATRAPAGDLVLEAFNDGEFMESTERSDQDLQSVSGNEAITLSVLEGQTLYFKVSAFSFAEGPIAYRLSAGLIPD